ncbi:type II toxin-antitoxin system RelE/ParE family toxin [Natronosporangium hydrolyticum]|uniref:Type II toxin-antitoxin system RelE/ParE family toxin n=1 Tax=Natronosporangium hydrolyticum TaxID=2811111 RepID=A0A895YG74_9ACTN|nr:type II toxin-antitoxin system RelE/ParE family toxin [Natronosporangium hydrolyticum]QSB16874.1 type II toxin-antitoxin system RelE/ParE family toxin [Natronosporangium hydrolyticum]
MTERSGRWKVKIQAAAQRALAEDLPLGVATAALEFIQHVLPANPYRVGGELSGRYAGQHSAHLGEYRIVYQVYPEDRLIRVKSIRRRADVYGVG